MCLTKGVVTTPRTATATAIIYRSAADSPLKAGNAAIPAGHVVVKFARADLPNFLLAQSMSSSPSSRPPSAGPTPPPASRSTPTTSPPAATC